MKRIAILVIAAVNQPVYRHYISTYWTDLIRHTNKSVPNIDVFLLCEHGMAQQYFDPVADNTIVDPDDGVDLLEPRFRTVNTPGILSKTIHALDVLAGEYDVFLRTNLSSIVMLPAFQRFVQDRSDLGYSGCFVWKDALRADLLHHDRVGPGKSIGDLSELDHYPGNTFISGSAFFLNAGEADHLVAQRRRLRYDLPDDVAVGLMLDRHEHLRTFTEVIRPESSIADMLHHITTTDAPHIRLEHFPVERAQALWRYLCRDRPWRLPPQP